MVGMSRVGKQIVTSRPEIRQRDPRNRRIELSKGKNQAVARAFTN